MEEKATYQCTECPKKFTHKGTLNRHKRSIHEQLGSICPKCGVKFNREYALKRHMENCGKMYECDNCDKCYNTITYLKIHKLSEHKDSLVCTQCKSIFKTV